MNLEHRATKKLNVLSRASMAAAILAAASVSAHAQTFSVLYQFPNTGGLGNFPAQMSMIQATDGNFYGTTFAGGVQGSSCCGTIFKVTSAGQFTSLYAFCAQNNCPDGRSPQGGLVQARDGNFYGTTYAGGANNQGTIYRITPLGALTTLHSFCHVPNSCSPDDGAGPVGALIVASNGDLYGTTSSGTAFKTNLKGKFTLLYTWPTGSGPDGALLQIGDGDLYGTTSGGGADADGSVFRMTLGGKVKTLYSFGSQPNCADGQAPQDGLVQGADGNLYGTTSGGGDSGCGGYGTVFRISTKGKLTTLASFEAETSGANPVAPMILGTDGNLYGTTLNGGDAGGGTVFQISNGTLSNVYPLSGCYGGHPYGGLLQSTNGDFYGSDDGGCGADGTLFEFSNGLGPFVTAIPSYGAVAAKIVIQGTDLTGATSVTFNGTPAKFKIVSASEIKATVPAGATSGTVDVTTPGGTLASNIAFTIVN
jgi:uncharacterized repeat protein (TIGR03803 family)